MDSKSKVWLLLIASKLHEHVYNCVSQVLHKIESLRVHKEKNIKITNHALRNSFKIYQSVKVTDFCSTKILFM